MSQTAIPITIPELYPWQQQVRADFQTHRFVIVSSGRQIGKALALDTPIPTAQGWKALGEVTLGDLLFDECGRPCRVMSITETMLDRPCYRVVFSDGSEIVADAEHRWLTHDKQYRKALGRAKTPRSGAAIHTTAEIHQTLRVGAKHEANHAVPVAAPVEWPERDLLIPPYLLGVWLGDGTSKAASIATEDPEIVQAFRDEGFSIHPSPEPFMWHISDGKRGGRKSWAGREQVDDSFQFRLRTLGVLGNKHIPSDYLTASVAQRLALLQGLMDTDGGISAKGIAEFTSIKRHLVDGVRALAASLGMKATVHAKRMKLNGRDVGEAFRVFFTATLPVFRLPRKLQRVKLNRSRSNVYYRYITAIEPVDSVPVRCLQVNSPSNLFLAGESFIPTHNTEFAVLTAMDVALLGGAVWWIAPTNRLANAGYDKLVRYTQQSPFNLKQKNGRKLVEEYKQRRLFTFNNGGLVGTIEVISADDPETVVSGTNDLVVFDEAGRAHPDAWYEGAYSTLTVRQGKALIISNPRGKNWFFDLWKKGDPESPSYDPQYISRTYSQFDNPTLDPVMVEAQRTQMSKRQYEREVLGMFTDEGGDVFVGVREASYPRPLIPVREAGHTYYGGIDWGSRNDYTVITIFDATTMRQVAVYPFTGKGWEEQWDEISTIQSFWQCVVYDAEENQVGFVNIEMLLKRGLPIRAFNTNVKTKRELIEAWATAIELKQVRILDDPELILQHESMERSEETAYGTVKFFAPHGKHDDYVISSALAYRAATVRDETPPVSMTLVPFSLYGNASSTIPRHPRLRSEERETLPRRRYR